MASDKQLSLFAGKSPMDATTTQHSQGRSEEEVKLRRMPPTTTIKKKNHLSQTPRANIKEVAPTSVVVTPEITVAPGEGKNTFDYLSIKWLERAYEQLVQGLRAYFRKNHFHRGVVGVSGGVDSALTLKIAVDAVGSENVTALLMPEHGVSNDENTYHARGLCEFLRVKYFIQPINNFFPEYTLLPWKPNRIALMNTKARIRAAMLYSYANTETALVLGTSNKSEILLGYGTKYGDLAADIEVISDLFKTEVIKLSDHIGMPPEITYKRPSAELAPGQNDEEELGAPYPDLDKVLMKRDLGPEGCVQHGLPLALVQLVFRRMAENEHKTKMPPVLSINMLWPSATLIS